MNITEVLNHGFSYAEYRNLIERLLLEGKTTGNTQNEKRVEFTRLNVQRMNRLDKTIKIADEITEKLKAITKPVTWLVVGDAWCGDCAQILPVINKVAEASGNKIELKITSKDSYPELTEYYHAQSIPKLLYIDNETNEVMETWGPRPKPAQEIMLKWKASNGKIAWDDFEKELHLWYARDKGVTIINELLSLIKETSLAHQAHTL